MRRFYIPTKQIMGEWALISADTAHHIVHVLRLEKGDRIILFSDDRYERLCEIYELSSYEVRLLIIEKNIVKNRPFHVALIQALPKLPKMDLIIEKTTELAVDEIYPVICERSPTQARTQSVSNRHKRWLNIARSASEQSRRIDVPRIHPVQLWKDFLPVLNDYQHKMICTTEDSSFKKEGDDLEKEMEKVKENERICVIIGPEGDFNMRDLHSHVVFPYFLVR